MAGLFFRQFWALFWKNWIVMSKHPWVRPTCIPRNPHPRACIDCACQCVWRGAGASVQLNVLRCFIMPIAYGIFLAVAQIFLNKPNNVSPVSTSSSRTRRG